MAQFGAFEGCREIWARGFPIPFLGYRAQVSGFRVQAFRIEGVGGVEGSGLSGYLNPKSM